MLSSTSTLRVAIQGNALRWALSACGALSAHSRGFAAAANDQTHRLIQSEQHESQPFDAAAASSPYSVHQLIGDPRTGIADDTTTAPWGEDVAVQWVWSDPDKGVEWYRYSEAGPNVLPYMYMDSRLSDHSKNLMYMLRCKDPQRWTIPALAEKFRIRRQRVMAILALKEIQAHRINQGLDMQGPMMPYSFRIPLQDFHIQPDGEPVDLAQLVAQQQQHPIAATIEPALPAGSEGAASDALGTLDEFLAVDSHSSPADSSSILAGSEEQSPNAFASLVAAAGGQAADLASLMPQVATTTQQLELQLLQLLQQHHYSTEQLQQQLLQQVDQAEAYYNAHIAGTPLEQLLSPPNKKSKVAAAAEDGNSAAEGAAADAAVVSVRPVWLDFDRQRQQVRDLVQALSPVLQFAGTAREREVGRVLAQLNRTLQEAGSSDSLAQANLAGLVKSAEQSGLLASAFNQLDTARRQQLLELLPEVRISLNVQGADLKQAARLGSTHTEADGSSSSNSNSSAAAADDFVPPGVWPGSVAAVVDVWNYEEVPQKHMAALQQQLRPVQQLLDSIATSGGSKSILGEEDLLAVQQATQVYSGLVYEYDKVLAEQAAGLLNSSEAPNLPLQAQRRMMRILRDLDMNALEKLLLWETVYKETAEAEGGGRASKIRLRRLVKRVAKAIKDLNKQAVAAGQAHPFEGYPDLPAAVPSHERVSADLALAHLDAKVVGRQFHRGSGDRHFKMIDTYPAFEGYSLEDFDRIQEGELSAVTRLASEREDNMMWKEFRDKLLNNLGLVAPDLHQHLYNARPPKPRQGWSYVVHPIGAEARARNRWELEQRRRDQYLDVEHKYSWYEGVEPGQLGAVEGFDPALNSKAPAEPYVAMPGRKFRGLNEEESVVVGYSKARPRKKWSKR